MRRSFALLLLLEFGFASALLAQPSPGQKQTRCLPAPSAPYTCAGGTEGRCYTDDSTSPALVYFCNGTSWVTSNQPTPTPAPTATPAPTFPSTGNFSTVVPYTAYTNDGNSSTAITINWATNGSRQKVTINGAATITLSGHVSGATALTLVMVHDATATTYALTWAAASGGVKWSGGTAIANTNTANAVDIVTCLDDGTNYYCIPNTAFS